MQGSRALAGIWMLFAVPGALLPLAVFLPWLGIHGMDAPLFLLAATG